MSGWRDRAIYCFCALFVAVQIAGPTYKLLASSELERFGWQMFSRNRIGTAVNLVFYNGETREFDSGSRFLNKRGDSEWERPFAETLCRENRSIKEILFIDNGTTYMKRECQDV